MQAQRVLTSGFRRLFYWLDLHRAARLLSSGDDRPGLVATSALLARKRLLPMSEMDEYGDGITPDDNSRPGWKAQRRTLGRIGYTCGLTVVLCPRSGSYGAAVRYMS